MGIEFIGPAFSFDALKVENPVLPPLQHFVARDNTKLPYRKYTCLSGFTNNVIVLLHGSAWHGQQFFKMAPELTQHADAYCLDLRGHGPMANRRGDVDYVGQLEDDLADFILSLKSDRPDLNVTMLGHSSGGGLAVRFAGGQNNKLVDRYILVAPFISAMAPVTRNDQNWAVVSLPKLVAISILDSLGVEKFNDRTVIHFNMPSEVRDGTETLAYSYRMLSSINPRQKYQEDIDKIRQPTLVLVGEKDEIFWPEKFKDLFGSIQNIQVRTIPNATHLSVLTDSKVTAEITKFLEKEPLH